MLHDLMPPPCRWMVVAQRGRLSKRGSARKFGGHIAAEAVWQARCALQRELCKRARRLPLRRHGMPKLARLERRDHVGEAGASDRRADSRLCAGAFVHVLIPFWKTTRPGREPRREGVEAAAKEESDVEPSVVCRQAAPHGINAPVTRGVSRLSEARGEAKHLRLGW